MDTQTFKDIIASSALLSDELKQQLMELANELSEEEKVQIVLVIQKGTERDMKILQKGLKELAGIDRSFKREVRKQDEKSDREQEHLPSFE